MDTHTVNALDETYSNASGPIREYSAVGRSLVRCQGCEHWKHLCLRQSREAWAQRLIRPGPECGDWRAG